ncbi:hypothetical protein JTB14_009219 [Gonioctena quinquepunctata]|nr:hypothetical protein JTB14_009219 [Gonioctena quinquepunctata]
MDVYPSTPANLPVTSDQKRELFSSPILESEAGTSKRIRSSDDLPKATATEPCTAESKPASGKTDEQRPSYGNVAACVKVGFLHQYYSTTSLKASHLESLQYAILTAVEDNPDGGPQESASWLEGAINALQPWKGALLKCVTGDELPRAHICVAYIPDEGSRQLSPEQVRTRLRKINHGLTTLERTILQKEISGPGQTWTFTIDDSSIAKLERLRPKASSRISRLKSHRLERIQNSHHSYIGAGFATANSCDVIETVSEQVRDAVISLYHGKRNLNKQRKKFGAYSTELKIQVTGTLIKRSNKLNEGIRKAKRESWKKFCRSISDVPCSIRIHMILFLSLSSIKRPEHPQSFENKRKSF